MDTLLWNDAAAAAGHAHPAGTQSLAQLALRTDAWVLALHMDAPLPDQPALLRLLEIGFLPGERVRVVARSPGGGDPLAVRVGSSTFALRRREAALVRVGGTPPGALAEAA